MRTWTILAGSLLALLTASCGGGGPSPTERDITNSLESTLQSVSGDWVGVVNGSGGVRLDFKLQEAAGGQVSGSGTMKEDSAAATVPITVMGTFQRPVLTLTFNGMVYEGRQVTGNLQGSYTTVGGISTALVLTASGYNRQLTILLQEK